MDKPNILYIMTDQQCRNMLSSYPGSQCKTPNLDKLIADATRFDNAYTICPLCTPARASMLSGVYPHAHGLMSNYSVWPREDFPEGTKLINSFLEPAGYDCIYVGKWHCGQEKIPRDYGFTGMDKPGTAGYGGAAQTNEYRRYMTDNNLCEAQQHVLYETCWRYGENEVHAGYSTGDERSNQDYFLASYAIDHIQKYNSDDGPWFMFLSFWNPHAPFFPPKSYCDMYEPKDIKVSDSLLEDLESKPYFHKFFRDRFCLSRWTKEEWQEIISIYYAQMTFLDAQIGRIVDYLESIGEYDNTAILFTSDHGDYMGAHGGMYDKERPLYEEIMRIPLFVKIPGSNSTGKCEKFVSNMDLAATCLELAGEEIPEHFHARSLVKLIDDNNAEWDDDFFGQFNGHKYLASGRMLRWSHWKYCFNAGAGDELYDLDKDPHELNNLADNSDFSQILEEGRARLCKWMESTGDNLLQWSEMMLK